MQRAETYSFHSKSVFSHSIPFEGPASFLNREPGVVTLIQRRIHSLDGQVQIDQITGPSLCSGGAVKNSAKPPIIPTTRGAASIKLSLES